MENWHFTPIAILYILAAIIAFSLSIFVGKLRDVRGKRYFRLLTFFSGIWTLGYMLFIFSTDVSIKLFMIRVEYLGIICSAVFWLFFVLSYTNSDNWLTIRMKILILIIPVITYIQILTFQHHNFFYTDYNFFESNGLIVSETKQGHGYYLWIAYSYFLLLTGGIILIRSIFNMPTKYRRQIISIVAVLFVILIPNFLFVIDKNILDPYDPTSLSFVIVGILFFMLIYFDNFLSIVPVAYNLVFKSTRSAVIIINQNGLILDLNPSAEKIFNIDQRDAVGSSVLKHIPNFEHIYNNLINNEEFRGEIDLAHKNKYYDLISAALKDYKKRVIGRILVFYDITERKRAIHELDAYARTVAHDLKSPMSSIYGFAQLLSDSSNLNEEEKRCSENISDGIMKMIDITDGLLLLSQVRNQEEVEIESVDIGKLVNRAVERLDDLIKKYKCEIDIAVNWPSVVGYPI
jgi:PAS domain S-box-containing protein